MDASDIHWLPDGFRVRFASRALPFAIRSELTLAYLAVAMFVASAMLLFSSLLLVAPGLYVWWWTTQRHIAEIEVTHGRLVVRVPLRRTVWVDVRDVRDVQVHHGELEILLYGGQRLRVPAPAARQRLQWVVHHIRQLRDEAQAFALEMAEQLEEADRVKCLLPVCADR